MGLHVGLLACALVCPYTTTHTCRWEFANPDFQQHNRDLLLAIHRRKPATTALPGSGGAGDAGLAAAPTTGSGGATAGTVGALPASGSSGSGGAPAPPPLAGPHHPHQQQHGAGGSFALQAPFPLDLGIAATLPLFTAGAPGPGPAGGFAPPATAHAGPQAVGHGASLPTAGKMLGASPNSAFVRPVPLHAQPLQAAAASAAAPPPVAPNLGAGRVKQEALLPAALAGAAVAAGPAPHQLLEEAGAVEALPAAGRQLEQQQQQAGAWAMPGHQVRGAVAGPSGSRGSIATGGGSDVAMGGDAGSAAAPVGQQGQAAGGLPAAGDAGMGNGAATACNSRSSMTSKSVPSAASADVDGNGIDSDALAPFKSLKRSRGGPHANDPQEQQQQHLSGGAVGHAAPLTAPAPGSGSFGAPGACPWWNVGGTGTGAAVKKLNKSSAWPAALMDEQGTAR